MQTIDFISITVQGFKCFKKQTKLEVRGPGFFLVKGRNELEPQLGANGAGKSSIWDALTWVLFGETTRGLKASKAANRDQAEQLLCLGSVELKKEDITYIIERSWNPNTLTLKVGEAGPELTTQDKIEQLIGCNLELFLHTVLMGQFGTFFFDLGATDKLNLFSRVLKLDSWMAASSSASAAVGRQENTLREVQRGISAAKGRQQSLEESLVRSKERAARFAEDQKRICSEIEAEQKRLIGLQEASAEEVKQSAEEAAELRVSVQKLTDAIVLEDKVRAEIENTQVRPVEDELLIKNNAIKKHQADLIALRKAARKTCPACGQALTAAHTEDEIERIERELAQQEKELEATQECLQVAKGVKAEAQAKIKAIDAQLCLCEQALAGVNLRHSQAKMGAKSTLKQLEDSHLRLKAEQTRINQAEQEALVLESELKEVGVTLSTLFRQEGSSLIQLEKTKFWIKGFKDLRLWLIETSLKQLEAEVNSAMHGLGLLGWRITFDVERENSGGTASRGFTVNILSPGDEQPAPWNSWSGGETQRLRVAGAIGFANLIRARTGFFSNLEVWDEPTTYMSEEGIEDLLNYLAERANIEGKAIWLIDHHSLAFGGFAGEVVVTKTASGSLIKQGAS